MACIEFTVYDGGHAAIAVSKVTGAARSRSIIQVDVLPLNNVDELREHVLAIVHHVAESLAPAAAGAEPTTAAEQ